MVLKWGYERVSLVEGQRQLIWVKLELKNCSWKQFTLDESNLPEDTLFTYPEQSVVVDLFGADAHLARLRTRDILLEPIFELEELQVGTNVATKLIPEPASATLSLAALMMLCARRRRK